MEPQNMSTHNVPFDGGYKQGHSFKYHVATFFTFIYFLFVTPGIFFCYLTVRISRKLWLKLLANRFPYIEFVEKTSIRTLLDTHRNQGVMNVLMTLTGACQPLQIRQALNDQIVEKRDQMGHLKYPKLRSGLVSCWGNYAWKTPVPFSIQNHLIIGNSSFRGRTLSSQNIQDYVSDIVSKYLPSHLPPWQIIVIPNIVADDEKYFILIRVHHLLIDDDEPLNIEDFFFVKSDNSPSESPSAMSIESVVDNNLPKSPLTNIVEEPKAIPRLCSILNESISNKWDQFACTYDPIESTQVTNSSEPGVFHCLAIILIALVKAIKDFKNTTGIQRNDYINQCWQLFKIEIIRRRITVKTLIKSVFITFSIKNCFIKTFNAALWFGSYLSFKLPYIVYSELTALIKYPIYQNAVLEFLYSYMPLLYVAGEEILYYCKLIYTAPISLLNELFFSNNFSEQHLLQTESLCGRKVVAWSKPVSRKTLNDIAIAMRATETEVLLAMTKNCLENYFHEGGLKMPETLLLTASTVNCNMSMTSLNSSNKGKSSGIVCISLPLNTFDNENALKDIIPIKEEIRRVRHNQGALSFLTSKQTLVLETFPSVIARVALNYWSRKFSVLLTEIVDSNESTKRETMWGHTISSFLYWKPPQGNISMSLTIQRYAGTVILGVMTDARLFPHHVNATHGWKETADRLASHVQSLNEN